MRARRGNLQRPMAPTAPRRRSAMVSSLADRAVVMPLRVDLAQLCGRVTSTP